jgi:hypothetical protein
MNKVVVAEIGMEGGGLTIFGCQSAGHWRFSTQGTTIDLDEHDDEIWRSWSSESVESLELVLPQEWPVLSHEDPPGLRGLVQIELRSSSSILTRGSASVSGRTSARAVADDSRHGQVTLTY